MVRLLSCLLFIVTCAAAVVQGLDAFMVTPLRGYMSKMINVEDQGKQVGAFLGLGNMVGPGPSLGRATGPSLDQGMWYGWAFLGQGTDCICSAGRIQSIHCAYEYVYAGALFSVVGSVEVLFTMVSVAYSYILPVLLHHHLRPGMVYVFLAGIGLIPVLFLRCGQFWFLLETCGTNSPPPPPPPPPPPLQCPSGNLVQR